MKKTIDQIIDQWALTQPQEIAVYCGTTSITYEELSKRSHAFSVFLQSKNIPPQTPICVSMEKSVDVIVVLLGILKTRCIYIPIDPIYPKERIQYVLKNSGAHFLVTQKIFAETFFAVQGEKIFLEDFLRTQHECADIAPLKSQAEDLAYVLYTSGSTGKPKGVVISHHNLIHAYTAWQKIYNLTPQDCHLQMASFAFDVFTGDFVRALCSGSRLILCTKDVFMYPEKLYEFLLRHEITCAEFVPASIRKLLNYLLANNKNLNFMRLVICGSDSWSIREYEQLQQLCGPHTRVINSYGVTEATIDSTFFEEHDLGPFNKDHNVPMGKPFPNTQVFLLNHDGTEVLLGDIGEIHIGGGGLSKGYFNQPSLTAHRFTSHTINDQQIRLYKTGDLGRLLPDGNIEFLGRADDQVKINGVRIELNDVEWAINTHHTIQESVVVLQTKNPHRHQLIAYVVVREGFELNAQSLNDFLNDKLPKVMIPSEIHAIEEIPLTPNGKINRLAFHHMVS